MSVVSRASLLVLVAMIAISALVTFVVTRAGGNQTALVVALLPVILVGMFSAVRVDGRK